MELSEPEKASEYVQRFQLREVIEQWINRVSHDRPDDPFDFLVRSAVAHRETGGGVVICPNPWCGMSMPSSQLEAHGELCNHRDFWERCARCNERVEASQLAQHKRHCRVKPCPYCSELVLPRMEALCPLLLRFEAERDRKTAEYQRKMRLEMSISALLPSPVPVLMNREDQSSTSSSPKAVTLTPRSKTKEPEDSVSQLPSPLSNSVGPSGGESLDAASVEDSPRYRTPRQPLQGGEVVRPSMIRRMRAVLTKSDSTNDGGNRSPKSKILGVHSPREVVINESSTGAPGTSHSLIDDVKVLNSRPIKQLSEETLKRVREFPVELETPLKAIQGLWRLSLLTFCLRDLVFQNVWSVMDAKREDVGATRYRRGQVLGELNRELMGLEASKQNADHTAPKSARVPGVIYGGFAPSDELELSAKENPEMLMVGGEDGDGSAGTTNFNERSISSSFNAAAAAAAFGGPLAAPVDFIRVRSEPNAQGAYMEFEDFTHLVRACSSLMILHKKLVTDITRAAVKILKQRRIVEYITIPPGGDCFVVGDLHGQLKDLLHIFQIMGYPSAKRIALFNGDYVDRGSSGCEVIILILGLLCTFPQFVYINRGNHEDRHTNADHGFVAELLAKYGSNAEGLLDTFVEAYTVMSLVTVVDQRVLVVHGGVPRYPCTLKEIEELEPVSEVPVIEQVSLSDKLLVDLLWNDPVEKFRSRQLGCNKQGQGWRKSKRGCGAEYMRSVSETFLNMNKLSLIIRSHDMTRAGFEELHRNKSITVFSASNYCGIGGNRGAIAVLSRKSERPVYHTWFLREMEAIGGEEQALDGNYPQSEEKEALEFYGDEFIEAVYGETEFFSPGAPSKRPSSFTLSIESRESLQTAHSQSQHSSRFSSTGRDRSPSQTNRTPLSVNSSTIRMKEEVSNTSQGELVDASGGRSTPLGGLRGGLNPHFIVDNNIVEGFGGSPPHSGRSSGELVVPLIEHQPFSRKGSTPSKIVTPSHRASEDEIICGVDIQPWIFRQQRTLQDIREQIFLNRYTLLVKFNQMDELLAGVVYKEEWCSILRDALGIDIPWYYVARFILPQLTVDGIDSVRYVSFLRHFNSAFALVLREPWQISTVCNIFSYCDLPEDLINVFGENDVGSPGLTLNDSGFESRKREEALGPSYHVVNYNKSIGVPSTRGSASLRLARSKLSDTGSSFSQSDESWRMWLLDFRFFAAKIRQVSAAASVLEDNEIFSLFSYFDGQERGHIFLGDMNDAIEETLSRQGANKEEEMEVLQGEDFSLIERMVAAPRLSDVRVQDASNSEMGSKSKSTSEAALEVPVVAIFPPQAPHSAPPPAGASLSRSSSSQSDQRKHLTSSSSELKAGREVPEPPVSLEPIASLLHNNTNARGASPRDTPASSCTPGGEGNEPSSTSPILMPPSLSPLMPSSSAPTSFIHGATNHKSTPSFDGLPSANSSVQHLEGRGVGSTSGAGHGVEDETPPGSFVWGNAAGQKTGSFASRFGNSRPTPIRFLNDPQNSPGSDVPLSGAGQTVASAEGSVGSKSAGGSPATVNVAGTFKQGSFSQTPSTTASVPPPPTLPSPAMMTPEGPSTSIDSAINRFTLPRNSSLSKNEVRQKAAAVAVADTFMDFVDCATESYTESKSSSSDDIGWMYHVLLRIQELLLGHGNTPSLLSTIFRTLNQSKDGKLRESEFRVLLRLPCMAQEREITDEDARELFTFTRECAISRLEEVRQLRFRGSDALKEKMWATKASRRLKEEKRMGFMYILRQEFVSLFMIMTLRPPSNKEIMPSSSSLIASPGPSDVQTDGNHCSFSFEGVRGCNSGPENGENGTVAIVRPEGFPTHVSSHDFTPTPSNEINETLQQLLEQFGEQASLQQVIEELKRQKGSPGGRFGLENSKDRPTNTLNTPAQSYSNASGMCTSSTHHSSALNRIISRRTSRDSVDVRSVNQQPSSAMHVRTASTYALNQPAENLVTVQRNGTSEISLMPETLPAFSLNSSNIGNPFLPGSGRQPSNFVAAGPRGLLNASFSISTQGGEGVEVGLSAYRSRSQKSARAAIIERSKRLKMSKRELNQPSALGTPSRSPHDDIGSTPHTDSPKNELLRKLPKPITSPRLRGRTNSASGRVASEGGSAFQHLRTLEYSSSPISRASHASSNKLVSPRGEISPPVSVKTALVSPRTPMRKGRYGRSDYPSQRSPTSTSSRQASSPLRGPKRSPLTRFSLTRSVPDKLSITAFEEIDTPSKGKSKSQEIASAGSGSRGLHISPELVAEGNRIPGGSQRNSGSSQPPILQKTSSRGDPARGNSISGCSSYANLSAQQTPAVCRSAYAILIDSQDTVDEVMSVQKRKSSSEAHGDYLLPVIPVEESRDDLGGVLHRESTDSCQHTLPPPPKEHGSVNTASCLLEDCASNSFTHPSTTPSPTITVPDPLGHQEESSHAVATHLSSSYVETLAFAEVPPDADRSYGSSEVTLMVLSQKNGSPQLLSITGMRQNWSATGLPASNPIEAGRRTSLGHYCTSTSHDTDQEAKQQARPVSPVSDSSHLLLIPVPPASSVQPKEGSMVPSDGTVSSSLDTSNKTLPFIKQWTPPIERDAEFAKIHSAVPERKASVKEGVLLHDATGKFVREDAMPGGSTVATAAPSPITFQIGPASESASEPEDTKQEDASPEAEERRVVSPVEEAAVPLRLVPDAAVANAPEDTKPEELKPKVQEWILVSPVEEAAVPLRLVPNAAPASESASEPEDTKQEDASPEAEERRVVSPVEEAAAPLRLVPDAAAVDAPEDKKPEELKPKVQEWILVSPVEEAAAPLPLVPNAAPASESASEPEDTKQEDASPEAEERRVVSPVEEAAVPLRLVPDAAAFTCNSAAKRVRALNSRFRSREPLPLSSERAPTHSGLSIASSQLTERLGGACSFSSQPNSPWRAASREEAAKAEFKPATSRASSLLSLISRDLNPKLEGSSDVDPSGNSTHAVQEGTRAHPLEAKKTPILGAPRGLGMVPVLSVKPEEASTEKTCLPIDELPKAVVGSGRTMDCFSPLFQFGLGSKRNFDSALRREREPSVEGVSRMSTISIPAQFYTSSTRRCRPESEKGSSVLEHYITAVAEPAEGSKEGEPKRFRPYREASHATKSPKKVHEGKNSLPVLPQKLRSTWPLREPDSGRLYKGMDEPAMLTLPPGELPGSSSGVVLDRTPSSGLFAENMEERQRFVQNLLRMSRTISAKGV